MGSLKFSLLYWRQVAYGRPATAAIANCKITTVAGRLSQPPFPPHFLGRFVLKAVGNVLSKDR